MLLHHCVWMREVANKLVAEPFGHAGSRVLMRSGANAPDQEKYMLFDKSPEGFLVFLGFELLIFWCA